MSLLSGIQISFLLHNYIFMCGPSRYTILIHISQKRYNFRGKRLFNIEIVFLFAVQLMFQTFLIQSRIERSVYIKAHFIQVKYPLVLSDFN
jgi:hypothetical protein